MKKAKENKGEITIKNMVCDRCIATVESSLKQLGAEDVEVKLGMARYSNSLDLKEVENTLAAHGFELIKNAQEVRMEQVKIFLQSLLNQLPVTLDDKLSSLLARQFAMSYPNLSKLFSQHQGITIERYFLLLKVEKAKELIQYGRLNFTEIAQQLDYAHVNHFSKQFKSFVGMSLSDYKGQEVTRRKGIDKIV